MAGSLTLGGMAAGTSGGILIFGSSTVAGNEVIGEMVLIPLEANVDYALKIPTGAVQWAAFFPQGASAPEVKVGSNLVTTTNGMPVAARGFVSAPVASGVTELKFKAVTPPSAFQVCFV